MSDDRPLCISSTFSVGSTFIRSFGDNTRGGGICYVRPTYTSCSADSTCISEAQATYGSQAHGYCYSGKCYARPGSDTTLCDNNPNRSPGNFARIISTTPRGTISPSAA